MRGAQNLTENLRHLSIQNDDDHHLTYQFSLCRDFKQESS